MHTQLRWLSLVVAVGVWVGGAMPLAAQSSAGQPAGSKRQPAPRRAQPTPQRSTGATGARSGPAAERQRGTGPVRKAQAIGRANPAPPREPFRLTPQQQQLLDQILLQWEKESEKVRTFKCTFGRWEVNPAFGPKGNNYWLSIGEGQIKFKAPDHGVYIVKKQQQWDAQRRAYVPRTEGLDHWVCNGKSIFEFNADKRQLIERKLAPSLQGKAITEGPLPFIFGAKADQLRRRYWMRDITPADQVKRQVWLEAWPKFQRDAANFQHAVVILNRRTFMPEALRIILPDGQNKQDYAFSGTLVNDPLAIFKGDFMQPRTPRGWQKVVEPALGNNVAPPGGRLPGRVGQQPAPRGGRPAQAQRRPAASAK